ncbi:MAG: hypothetical protein RLZZ253_799 [Verrucomicrobiota bacterium]
MKLRSRFRTGLFRGLGTLVWMLAVASAAMAEQERTGWPMHRGGPQLQGVAVGASPAKPVLSWTFRAGKPVKGGAAVGRGLVLV